LLLAIFCGLVVGRTFVFFLLLFSMLPLLSFYFIVAVVLVVVVGQCFDVNFLLI